MGWHRKRFSFQPIAEEFSISALQQAADRGAQLQQPRRNLLVQPLLIKHRRQKTDRDDDEGLILRGPKRHREAVDMRAP